MSLTQITDHVARALDSLHERHKDKPNIAALVTIVMSQVQEVEDAGYQLFTERLISTAVGEQLNVLGRIVGELRDGKSDADFRRFVRARIAANKSKGRWADMNAVARLVLDDATLGIINSESNYQTILMEITGALPIGDATILSGFLADTKSDTHRLLLKTSEYDTDNTYTLGSVTSCDPSGPSIPIGSTTIVVVSTRGFESSGSILIDKGGAAEEIVTYTSLDATNFYGTSATTFAHATFEPVHTADSNTQGLGTTVTTAIGGRLASVLT